jgi:undecaprenyldiphospho-muramoylpentapeptide beta-N-acetylglucosaminyltransferase
VYPALTVLKAISKEADANHWVGGKNGIESGLVRREGVPFEAIPAAGVHGVGLRSLPGNILRLVRGTFASLRIIQQFKPDVLFFTGGYLAVPMAFAGWRIPSVLYVPDIEPGMALQVLTRFARIIALTTDSSRKHFPSKKRLEVTGYPVRPELGQWNRKNASAKLGIHPELTTLLFFGGSLGARSINRSVIHHLEELLQRAQIVHITGNLDWEEVQAARSCLPLALIERYHIFSYLHEEMGAALASADLVISRAGASTLGEFPYFGLPAILIPYPHAWRYQKVNASYLQEHEGAILLQDELIIEQLVPLICSLLDTPQKLDCMREKMLSLRKPDAAEKIAQLIVEAAHTGGRT